MSKATKSVILDGKRISCNMTALSIILRGKWKPLILWQLIDKTLRFGDLRKNLQGISARILSKELQELEEHGIVSRREYASIPPKVEYKLTKLGKKMKPAMDALCNWSSLYMEEAGE